jgi:hypothetical protein
MAIITMPMAIRIHPGLALVIIISLIAKMAATAYSKTGRNDIISIMNELHIFLPTRSCKCGNMYIVVTNNSPTTHLIAEVHTLSFELTGSNGAI